jgi:hypothetical protein
MQILSPSTAKPLQKDLLGRVHLGAAQHKGGGGLEFFLYPFY